MRHQPNPCTSWNRLGSIDCLSSRKCGQEWIHDCPLPDLQLQCDSRQMPSRFPLISGQVKKRVRLDPNDSDSIPMTIRRPSEDIATLPSRNLWSAPKFKSEITQVHSSFKIFMYYTRTKGAPIATTRCPSPETATFCLTKCTEFLSEVGSLLVPHARRWRRRRCS